MIPNFKINSSNVSKAYHKIPDLKLTCSNFFLCLKRFSYSMYSDSMKWRKQQIFGI